MVVDYEVRMGGELESGGVAELRSALSWWLEAGVDVATGEEPRNWLNPTPSERREQPSQAAAAPTEEGRRLPDTFEEFRNWLSSARDLPFASSGARRVLPTGPVDSSVMLLTDMPADDCQPELGPLGGEARALVERMLAAAGLNPADAYTASLSCFQALAGLTRGPELSACSEIARRHVALAQPRRLLLLGDGPCKALLGKPLAAARGHVHKVEGVRTVATFHPAFLIQYPLQKAAAWSDLLMLTEDL